MYCKYSKDYIAFCSSKAAGMANIISIIMIGLVILDATSAAPDAIAVPPDSLLGINMLIFSILIGYSEKNISSPSLLLIASEPGRGF